MEAPRELHASEIERNLADAERFRSETLRNDKQSRLLDIEIETAKERLRVSRIDADAHERTRREIDARDLRHHVLRFIDDVSDDSVQASIAQMAIWDRMDPTCEMEIIFTSPGGSIVDGLALYDYIGQLRRKGHRIVTSALGMAASMAGVLLQAGDVRRMGPAAWLLIHEGSLGAIGSVGQVEDRVEFGRKLRERILDILAERSTLGRDEIKKRWERKDWWLSATEALELGFVDEIA